MHQLKIVLLFVLVSTILAFIAGGLLIKNHKTEKIHFHAGFVVFKDNKQLDFSDFKYMKVEPCNTNGSHEEKEDDQLEKAHLHDLIGDVVHVHRKNALWGDLFKNIGFNIDKNSTAYINGEQIENILDYRIKPYDSLVVLIGKNDKKQALKKAVTKNHIEETERRSENCGN